MATLHVWKNSPAPNPNLRFPNKQSAARTIGAALAIVRPGETIVVYGDCGVNRCKYRENIVITTPGLTLVGRDWPIIDGGRVGRAVDINTNSRRIVTIDSFEILKGKTAANGGAIRVHECAAQIIRNCIHHNNADKGGGIAVERQSNQAPVTIESNHIHNNKSKFHGGGIYQMGNTVLPAGVPPILITENLIHHNQAGSGSGGGFVHGGGVAVFRDTTVIRHNHIYKNRTSGGEHYGGGVGVFNVDENQGPARYAYLFGTSWSSISISQALLEHNLIEENRSRDGGGVSGLWAASVVYKRNTIRKNSTSDDAGAIYGSVVTHHRLEENNFIDDNSANEFGGGIHVTCSSRLEIIAGNIISNNKTSQRSGGGISVRNGELSITGPVLISGNRCKGKGGGIYVWTMNLPTSLSLVSVGFQLCEMDSEALIDGAIIENNTSQLEGGGVCIEKDHWLTRVRVTNVLNSIFRSNRSTNTRFAGLAIISTANGRSGFTPVVDGNLFESHATPQTASAVLFRGVANTTMTPKFRSNLVRSNGGGTEFYWAKGAIAKGNHFTNQFKFQIRCSQSSLAASSNELDGNNRTSVGIENPNIIPAGRMDFIWGGNITKHRNFGAWSPIARKIATGNWWGNPQGPNAPGLPPRPGADNVSPLVVWNPPSGGAAQLRLPTGPALTPPTPTPPPAVGFSMPSEVYRGLDCGRAGPAGAPGTYIPPTPEDESRRETGRSSSGKRVSSKIQKFLDSNNELHDALETSQGDLILIDSEGSSEGVLTLEGHWYPATQSIIHAPRDESAVTGYEDFDTLPLRSLKEVILKVLLPKVAFEDTKEKIVPQWNLKRLESAGKGKQRQKTRADKQHYEVEISFAGWPLLVARTTDQPVLDLSKVRISLDSAFQSAKISVLPKNWVFTLQLPIDDGWYVPLEDNTEIKAYFKDKRSRTKEIGLPESLGYSESDEHIQVNLLNENETELTRVISVKDFQGGELKIVRKPGSS